MEGVREEAGSRCDRLREDMREGIRKGSLIEMMRG